MKSDHPISNVQWIPIEKVQANDYNPNAVAKNEMRLLYTSIKADGYTQPIVVVENPETGMFEIVDGFHRFTIMKIYKDISESTEGLLPCVVLDKNINDRMASTVRHNRARGKHSVAGMSSIVFGMLENGWEDTAICEKIGLTAEELSRYKHVTGFSKLFESVEYQRAWITKRQLTLKREYEQNGSIKRERPKPSS